MMLDHELLLLDASTRAFLRLTSELEHTIDRRRGSSINACGSKVPSAQLACEHIVCSHALDTMTPRPRVGIRITYTSNHYGGEVLVRTRSHTATNPHTAQTRTRSDV